MWTPRPFQTAVDDGWIDYNGHMRDGYYALAVSHAIDDLMDQLGMDAHYRASTGATLYTIELHLHFLHEVKGGETLTLRSHPIGLDGKRLHLGLDLFCPRYDDPAACSEVMLLHVGQRPRPGSAPFPGTVAERLSMWIAMTPGAASNRPGSGPITLTRR